jgi:hypothetical protein
MSWKRLYTYLRRRLSFADALPSDCGKDTYVSIEDPVVIGGAGRSGTTLLSVILNAHPDVYCGDEHGLLSREGTSISKIVDIHDLDADRLKKLAADSWSRWQFVERVIRTVKSVENVGVFTTKNPTYIFDLPTILGIFPNARFIHMYRDGRDVAVSMREHPDHVGVRYDATYDEEGELSVRYCAQTWRTFINASRTFRSDDRTHAVAYEDLVTRPAETIRRLCEFLDLKYVSSMVHDHERGFEGRTDPIREHHQRLHHSIQDDRVQNWTRKLTSAQVREFERHAAPALRYMGYSLASEGRQ